MINSVSLTGRLTKPVDLKYTQSGVAMGSFTLAVDRQFTTQNGQREADFINCIIWRKSAENLSNLTRKGSMIGVMGHMQTSSYDNNQGQHVFATQVVVENFSLLESKATTEARPTGGAPQQNYGQQQYGNQTQSGGFGGSTQNQQPYPTDDNRPPF